MGHISVSPLIPGFPVSGKKKLLINPPTNKHNISLPLKRKVNHSQRFPEILFPSTVVLPVRGAIHHLSQKSGPAESKPFPKSYGSSSERKDKPRNISKRVSKNQKQKHFTQKKTQKHKKNEGEKFAPHHFCWKGMTFFVFHFAPNKNTKNLAGTKGPTLGSHRLCSNLGNFIPNWKGFFKGPLKMVYTTWKVDGATPMYWFILAPY